MLRAVLLSVSTAALFLCAAAPPALAQGTAQPRPAAKDAALGEPLPPSTVGTTDDTTPDGQGMRAPGP